MNEAKIEYALKTEMVWQKRPEFLKLNPAGDVPVLVEEDGTILADSVAICEYVAAITPDLNILGDTPKEGAEVRRLVAWFDQKMQCEVSDILIEEKLMKRFLRMGEPRSDAIRKGLNNLKNHMQYICYLADRRNYLAANKVSMADFAAAAHISVLDYLGDIDWDKYPSAKDWYIRVKSRKAFRPLLEDQIAGLKPPDYYAQLDF